MHCGDASDVRIENTLEPWCHEATRDNIRHYAHGIGDDNPLWCDPDYAAKTRWAASSRCRVSCSRPAGSSPAMSAACPACMRCGPAPTGPGTGRCSATTRSRTEAWLKDLIEHETRFAGRAIQQVYHVNFFNQRGDLVAEADSWCFRTDRDQAREEGTKYTELKARPPHALHAKRNWHASTSSTHDEEVRGADSALLGGRRGRRCAADNGQGADDGDRIHRLRAGLGRALYPRQQAGLEADPCASGSRHPKSLRHSRLSRARALGAGVRADGRRAGRVRLWPGALLLADAPPDQLDGRRRLSAPRELQDPPAQSGRRHCCSSTARCRASSSRTGGIWSRSRRRRATRTASCRLSGSGIVELPVRQPA